MLVVVLSNSVLSASESASSTVRRMITMSNCSNVTYFIIDVPSVLFKKERDNIISFLIQVTHAILITVNTSRTNAQTWGHLSSLIHHTIIAFIKVFHFRGSPIELFWTAKNEAFFVGMEGCLGGQLLFAL